MAELSVQMLDELSQEQRGRFLARPPGTERDVDLGRLAHHGRVVAITGVRRCGKSTLLRQIAARLGTDFGYFNFDDERAHGFDLADFETLLQAFQRHGPTTTLLFDEIQNVPEWERFVRRVHDEGIKVYLTGSNANLLSRELGTRLTGRHVQVALYPFSFREVLRFRGISATDLTSAGKARLGSAMDEFLVAGGFPETLAQYDPELLQRTYEDIIYRDIAARHGIRDTKALVRLAHLLFTQMACEVNYGRLREALPVASTTTVRQYAAYLEDACLVFELRPFDFSLKRQYVTGRKGYVVDNGMRRAVAFQTGSDAGHLLENAVHLELRCRGGEIYYFRGKGECDFIRRDCDAATIIQVCLGVNAKNRHREIRGLVEAAQAFGVTDATLVTQGQEGNESVDGIRINTIPAWRWFLNAHE
jgi:predicted AAA+ superfamily ATPase